MGGIRAQARCVTCGQCCQLIFPIGRLQGAKRTTPVELGSRFPDLSFLDLKFLYDLGDVDVHWESAVVVDFQVGLESWFFAPEHYHSKGHRLEARRHEEYPAVHGPVQGNNARHHRRALISNNVIGFPNGCMVLGGAQGFGAPALEAMFQSCG